ncbi:MAG: hypothetical protein ABIH77_04560 [Pseudomonadota bacterium]|nr:hypothetical protein [Gammaproteobacteria bacterium]MBU1558763.1 hypothetical protein [Gammaproteobacteria bacterium]MBU1628710.1 hypothetical protein [Gammaproteobacteria bacterium]
MHKGPFYSLFDSLVIEKIEDKTTENTLKDTILSFCKVSFADFLGSPL